MDRALAFDEVDKVKTRGKGWIHSPEFDLSFFILSPALGFALALVGVQFAPLLPLVALGGSYFIGVPHYLASFAFFFGDENRRYANRYWYLFYAVPVLILATVTALYAAGSTAIVHAAMFVWNLYHVATQSSGILSLYRQLSGGGQVERKWAHRTILFANAAMAFWFLERFPPLWNPLVAVHGGFPDLLRFGCLGAALIFAVGYVHAIARRGFPLSTAEAACLVSSLLLFTPYLWVEDSNFATLTMLIGHFIQYLAIVWLLNRRKYRPASGSRGQRGLGRISESRILVALFILAAGLVFVILDRGSQILQISLAFFVFFNALAFTHFYLDGLIWAFRNPFIRKTVGPFLTLEAQRLR